MIFSRDEAFQQLRDEGVVFTFRTNRRENGPVWIRRSRTGPKAFDAHIVSGSLNVTPHPEILSRLVEKSGFASVEKWREAIHNVHGEDVTGDLYKVYRQEAYEAYRQELKEKFPQPTCPECGSKVREKTRKKQPHETRGFGTESDLWTWNECPDCGWQSEKR